ncbi:MAG TPA: polyprenyl synthetase family protein, partial [Microbacteriaceae bacterium]|nr:polyprenyl synthetase family protein [Microbacteriaceae bacterium]
LIAHARMTPSWPHIEDLHGRSSLTDDECKRLRVLLEDCGAKRFTESLIGDQLRAFNELLVEHNLLIPEPLSIIISRLSSELEGRLV